MNESNQSISILMAIYWPFLVRAFSVGFVRRIASFGTDFAFTCFLVAFLQRLTNARWYISPIYFSESRHADGIFTSKYSKNPNPERTTNVGSSGHRVSDKANTECPSREQFVCAVFFAQQSN